MYKSVTILLLCGLGMLAQTAINPKDASPQKGVMIQMGDSAEFGPIGITTAMAGPAATIAGAPYSAQAVTERVQVLADGNRIVQSTSGGVARDSQGRVPLPGLISGKSGAAPHLVFIEDPVAGVHWNLDAQTKTAFKMPFMQTKAKVTPGGNTAFVPPPIGPEKIFFFSAMPIPSDAHYRVIGKSQILPDPHVAKTDLGTQAIEGVTAQGTRITRTLPAGEVGNEQPLVITTETWYSPDLKVLVMSKTNDPRMGETTYRLVDIQRAEPPASSFEVPDDYTIKDKPGNQMFYQPAK